MFETRTEIKKKSSKNILIFTKFTLIYPHGVLFYLVLYVYANFVIFIIKKKQNWIRGNISKSKAGKIIRICLLEKKKY